MAPKNKFTRAEMTAAALGIVRADGAEEDYCLAIEEVKEAIRRYDPSVTGYRWDEENPRIQLEPVGSRGYIEMLAVK